MRATYKYKHSIQGSAGDQFPLFKPCDRGPHLLTSSPFLNNAESSSVPGSCECTHQLVPTHVLKDLQARIEVLATQYISSTAQEDNAYMTPSTPSTPSTPTTPSTPSTPSTILFHNYQKKDNNLVYNTVLHDMVCGESVSNFEFEITKRCSSISPVDWHSQSTSARISGCWSVRRTF